MPGAGLPGSAPGRHRLDKTPERNPQRLVCHAEHTTSPPHSDTSLTTDDPDAVVPLKQRLAVLLCSVRRAMVTCSRKLIESDGESTRTQAPARVTRTDSLSSWSLADSKSPCPTTSSSWPNGGPAG